MSVDVKEAWDGKMAVIDGETGMLYVDPDEETLAAMEKKKQAEEEKERLLQELKDKEDVTLDGTKVKLYANIGDVSDVAEVLKSNAAGIGLFRSEFLYLEKKTYPTGGRAVCSIPSGGGDDGGKRGHYPHSGHRRRQAGGLL